MRPAPSASEAALDRWDRIGLGVRCAYNPFCGCIVHHYLEAGRRVIACGTRTQEQVYRRMLTVLLQVAHDTALPWTWRSICLDHSAYPLARLLSLLGRRDPLACEALQFAVQAAHDQLSATPPGADA